MNFDRSVNFRTQTSGNGYWSEKKKFVTINRVRLAYIDEDDGNFGELRAYFNTAEWDVNSDGLIYTDPGWKESFLACMENVLGFSPDAILAINYSEAGMQGSNYVSMDVEGDFIRECEPLYRFTINREAVNS
jgi:hypothetical protein